MARNKNSTALFDVIHAAKKPPKASPSASIPTPRWWGKDKAVKKVPTPAPVVSTENVGRQQSWLTAAKKNGAVPTPPMATAPVATPVEPAPSVASSEVASSGQDVDQSNQTESVAEPVAASPVPAKTRFIDRFVNRSAPATRVADTTETTIEAVTVVTESTSPTPAVEHASQWTDSEFVQINPAPPKAPSKAATNADPIFRVDSTSKEFRFRLSYGGIIAIAFIVLMALAIAFIAGTRTAPETAQSESNPAKAKEATDAAATSGMAVALPGARIKTDTVKTETPKPDPSKGSASPNVMDVGGHKAKPAVVLESFTEKQPAPLLPVRPTRDIGMNYVVIQSYAEQDLAQKACDFVNQAGVPCTLVQGPAEWAPHDWYSVIGLQPFAKHDPALADYERKIRAIGGKFSNNILNQFDPRAYTWRENSDMSQQ
jgi:hypothetical protein